MYVWMLLSCLIFLLPTCASTKNNAIRSEKHALQKRNRVPIDSIQEQEAKLVDLPIPLNALPNPRFFTHEEIHSSHAMLGYVLHAISSNDVAEFYIHEMERLGWQQIMHFEGVEQQFIFSKPGKVCVISIRQGHKKVELVVVVSSTGSSFLI
jgi:hypothetical protein